MDKEDKNYSLYKYKFTGEEIFTGIGIVFYIVGFGLSIGSSYLIFKDLVGESSEVPLPNTNSANLREAIETISLALCSFLILMAIFCFLGTVSSVRICFNMKKDGGDHLTLFVFNCILLFLSFVSLLSFGLVYGAEDSANVSPGSEIILPFYTSLVISVISFIFIIIYIAKPSYLVDLPLIEERLSRLEKERSPESGEENKGVEEIGEENETGDNETEQNPESEIKKENNNNKPPEEK